MATVSEDPGTQVEAHAVPKCCLSLEALLMSQWVFHPCPPPGLVCLGVSSLGSSPCPWGGPVPVGGGRGQSAGPVPHSGDRARVWPCWERGTRAWACPPTDEAVPGAGSPARGRGQEQRDAAQRARGELGEPWRVWRGRQTAGQHVVAAGMTAHSCWRPWGHSQHRAGDHCWLGCVWGGLTSQPAWKSRLTVASNGTQDLPCPKWEPHVAFWVDELFALF